MEREQLTTTVRAAQQGDEKALSLLFNTYYNDVYYFALKTLKDEDLACDITQETFVEIINTLQDLKEPAAFVTWIRQIAYHQCTRYFKKKKEVLVEEDEDGNTVFDTLEESREEFIPGEGVDKEDFRATILGLLDTLSEEQRSAVLMHYFHEMSVKDIADAQQVSEGTVKSRLNYARKSLKKSVEDYEKKHDVKLHCAGVLPLLLWLFASAGKEVMPVAAAKTVAGGVAAATGVPVALSTGGGVATATATAAAAVTAASTTTTVTAAAGTGLIAKIAALPLTVKIISGIIAVALVIGGVGTAITLGDNLEKDGLLHNQNNTSDQGSNVPSLQPNPEAICGNIVPKGCKYTMNDGTVLTEGEYMPQNMQKFEYLTTPEYTYRYNGSGWQVRVIDQGKEQYGVLYSKVNGVPVVNLSYTFEDCENMTVAPQIPKEVTNLSFTFRNCSSLIEAPVIPDGVTELWGTFDGCSSLTKAPAIPQGVTDMDYTFRDCSSLVEAPVIPDGVTELWATFEGCSSLTKAPVIPKGVTNMNSTFWGCSSLVQAPVIPNGVTDLSLTFAGCRSLTKAPVIPASVIEIQSTFYGCTSLTGVIEINATLPPYIDCRDLGKGGCHICDENNILCYYCEACMAYSNCLASTEQPIVLTGSCGDLYSIALRAGDGNITVNSPCAMPLQGVDDIIPDGCSYIDENGNIYTAGQEFPGPPTDGVKFITPDYTYYYGDSIIANPDGSITFVTLESWCPIANDKTKSSYSGIYDSINGYYVTSLYGTFEGCKNLIIPPAIPSRVTNISGAFEGCTSMTTAPFISRRVIYMTDTFRGCVSLTGTIIIHADDQTTGVDGQEYIVEYFCYDDCFYGTTQPIVLVGTSSQLGELADTSSKGNVTVQQ